MKRRSFLTTAGSAIGIGTLGVTSHAATDTTMKEEKVGGMLRRPLGRTGEKVSIVGFPGLGLAPYDQDECNARLKKAFDRGVNYYDVAPAYGNDGEAEIKMGVGLQGLDRDKIILGCKTQMRDKEGARKELERSLKRLKTDRFDIYQLHVLDKPKDIKQVFAPGGAMETFLEARKEGKIRFIGFCTHGTRAALSAMKQFDFDTIMYPINYIDYFHGGFGKRTMAMAQKKGVAILAMKSLCGGKWPAGVERTYDWWYRPIDDNKEVDMAYRFSLSQPNVAASIPAAWLDIANKAIASARAYRPITPAELKELEKMADLRIPQFTGRKKKTAMRSSDHDGCPYSSGSGAYG